MPIAALRRIIPSAAAQKHLGRQLQGRVRHDSGSLFHAWDLSREAAKAYHSSLGRCPAR